MLKLKIYVFSLISVNCIWLNTFGYNNLDIALIQNYLIIGANCHIMELVVVQKGSNMKIGIASDHAGFKQKQVLATHIRKCGHEVVDMGPNSDDRVDYPDYAEIVAKGLNQGCFDMGVLVCGTGIGMAIAACKIPGIRAANIINQEFAALCREHNDANLITLSGRFVSVRENKAILDTFFSTTFGGGRHSDRVAKINALDGYVI